MLPSIHLIVSLILVVILFPFFGFYSFFVLIGGFLIDLDHVIFYWIRFKSFNLKRTYDYYRNIELKKDVKEYKKVPVIFHSIEFIILIVIFSFYYKAFWVLLIGMIVHIIMDMIHEYSKFKTRIKQLSLIWYIIKNAKKQKE